MSSARGRPLRPVNERSTLYGWTAGYRAQPTLERPVDDACERRFVADCCPMRSAGRSGASFELSNSLASAQRPPRRGQVVQSKEFATEIRQVQLIRFGWSVEADRIR
jgi:hypothetical protein